MNTHVRFYLLKYICPFLGQVLDLSIYSFIQGLRYIARRSCVLRGCKRVVSTGVQSITHVMHVRNKNSNIPGRSLNVIITHYYNSNFIWRTVSCRVDEVIPSDHPRRETSFTIVDPGIKSRLTKHSALGVLVRSDESEMLYATFKMVSKQ